MEELMEEGLKQEETVAQATAPASASDEDILIAEIDAFRDKATQLQQLIAAKEAKAAELEALVREKEANNKALQEELAKRQQEADDLVSDVETQVDRMMQVVKANMTQLETDIKTQVDDSQGVYEEHNRNLQDTLRSVSDGLGTIQSELSEKTHSESVHLYRLIQDLLKEHDNSEELIRRSDEHYNSLKGIGIAAIVLSSLSLVAGIANILLHFGIF